MTAAQSRYLNRLDEAVAETIVVNEYEFLADGTRA